MFTELLLSVLSWLFVIRPLLDRPALVHVSEGKGTSVEAVLAFCRPHTVKGTVLACSSGYLLLSVYFLKSAISALILVLVSGVSANVFIVGINQLVDVESDRVNGKNLPIATGQLAWTRGRDIVGISWVIAITVGFYQSFFWGEIISAMCVIGILYSVPPFRLKRFALPAALCIVLARALLGTVGGALTYMEAMEIELDSFTRIHLQWFTGIMTVFTTVIALMKDVPDIKGDKADGVNSLSVIAGAEVVSNICFVLLTLMYVAVSMAFSSALCGLTHVGALIWLWGSKSGDAMHDYFQVIWPLFYYEFIAFLAPIVLPNLSLIPMFVLGLEFGYFVVRGRRDTKTACIDSETGIDMASAHRFLNIPESEEPVSTAASRMILGIGMHMKLSRSSILDVRKLGILAGDWLLAKAVLSLCETRSHAVIAEMGKAIMTATAGPEKEIAKRISKHAKVAEACNHSELD